MPTAGIMQGVFARLRWSVDAVKPLVYPEYPIYMNAISDNDRALMRWLQVCLLLVFAMVILGGVTRLTGSGLSMVTWHPTGALPPLSTTEWQAEFERYQQYPEYQKLNRGMSLDEFKSIFWFEYSHRMLGRLIGLVFFAPFMFFWLRKMIRPGLTNHLA